MSMAGIKDLNNLDQRQTLTANNIGKVRTTKSLNDSIRRKIERARERSIADQIPSSRFNNKKASTSSVIKSDGNNIKKHQTV